jgi:hypothetical protein
VYENTTEINRVVEYPVESLEKDLLRIMSRQMYKPNYTLQKQQQDQSATK